MKDENNQPTIQSPTAGSTTEPASDAEDPISAVDAARSSGVSNLADGDEGSRGLRTPPGAGRPPDRDDFGDPEVPGDEGLGDPEVPGDEGLRGW